MRLRKLRVLLIPVLATALAFAGSSPANAAGAAAGVVTGTVRTNPGVPTDPQAGPSTGAFEFVTTVIAGSITVVDATTNVPATYDGTVGVSAKGPATDTLATGTGSVNELSGGGSSATGSITVNLAGPSGVFDNTFTRVGADVVVKLHLTVTVTTNVGSTTVTATGNLGVVVKAVFASTTTTGNITEATFAGSFDGA